MRKEGMELDRYSHELTGAERITEEEGIVYHVSKGRVSRLQMTEQCVSMALIPWLNKKAYGSEPPNSASNLPHASDRVRRALAHSGLNLRYPTGYRIGHHMTGEPARRSTTHGLLFLMFLSFIASFLIARASPP